MKNKTKTPAVQLSDVVAWLKEGQYHPRLGTFNFNEGEYPIDGEPPDRIILATREHGIRDDRGDTYGREDIVAAFALSKLIKAQFPTVKVEVQTIDEWVDIDITL